MQPNSRKRLTKGRGLQVQKRIPFVGRSTKMSFSCNTLPCREGPPYRQGDPRSDSSDECQTFRAEIQVERVRGAESGCYVFSITCMQSIPHLPCWKKYTGWFANDVPLRICAAQTKHAISVRRKLVPLKQSYICMSGMHRLPLKDERLTR